MLRLRLLTWRAWGTMRRVRRNLAKRRGSVKGTESLVSVATQTKGSRCHLCHGRDTRLLSHAFPETEAPTFGSGPRLSGICASVMLLCQVGASPTHVRSRHM